jgi:hypothetical protein
MRTIICAAMLTLATFTAAEAQTRNRAGVAAPPAGSDGISCDTFMKRLREAGRVLTFPLPPVKIERNPYAANRDAFWISYPYPDRDDALEEGEELHEGTLDCTRGHIDDYQMDLDHFARWRTGQPEALRNIHIVAAAIYAYTGWQPRQTIALANKLVAKQPHDLKDSYDEKLPNEGGIGILYNSVMVSSKCDPIAHPELCGPATKER